MAIVTITSDWSRRDFYSGMLKGRLLSVVPDLQIVDVNQEIAPFKTLEGAFIMRQVWQNYPAGSIHLFLVNQGNHPDIYPVVIKKDDVYLIGWEDAALGLILDEYPDWCVRITPDVFNRIKQKIKIEQAVVHPSFPDLGLFPVLVAAINRGVAIDEIGQNDPGIIISTPWLPVIQDQTISGRIIYVDSYGNSISNISKDLFTSTVKDRRFDIFLISNHYKIDQISTGYLETEPGDMLALFNSVDLLEVAIVHGHISDLLGVETGSVIKVKIYE